VLRTLLRVQEVVLADNKAYRNTPDRAARWRLLAGRGRGRGDRHHAGERTPLVDRFTTGRRHEFHVAG
jgi:hypothetical protein